MNRIYWCYEFEILLRSVPHQLQYNSTNKIVRSPQWLYIFVRSNAIVLESITVIRKQHLFSHKHPRLISYNISNFLWMHSFLSYLQWETPKLQRMIIIIISLAPHNLPFQMKGISNNKTETLQKNLKYYTRSILDVCVRRDVAF